MVSSAEVFERLRSEILSGQFEASKPIDAKALAEEYITSAAPIREALLRLSERGILRWERNRGFFIMSLNGSTANMIFAQLRAAYVHSIARKTDIPIELMLMNCESVNQNLAAAKHYLLLQEQIHDQLFSEAEKNIVIGQWDRLWSYRNRYFRIPHIMELLLSGATQILEFLRHSDNAEAIEVINTLFDAVMVEIPRVSSTVQ